MTSRRKTSRRDGAWTCTGGGRACRSRPSRLWDRINTGCDHLDKKQKRELFFQMRDLPIDMQLESLKFNENASDAASESVFSLAGSHIYKHDPYDKMGLRGPRRDPKLGTILEFDLGQNDELRLNHRAVS